jgi:hypothetical protein
MSHSHDESNHNHSFPSRNYIALKALKIVVFVAVLIGVIGWVFMNLWNWLVPDIFGLKPLDYVHALGLLVLSRIIFGGRPGWHRRGGHHWKQRIHAKWERMSPEEREKFRSGMESRWCQFSEGRRPARASGISQGSQRP